jgi:hypothetical protein
MLLQVALQVGMVLYELIVLDQRGVVSNQFGEFRMVVEKLIESGYLLSRQIRITILRQSALRLRLRRRCPNEGSERQGCEPIPSCDTCAFHKVKMPPENMNVASGWQENKTARRRPMVGGSGSHLRSVFCRTLKGDPVDPLWGLNSDTPR